MNRQELERFLEDTYSVTGETPWPKTPENRVFRHMSNKKWFAVLMDIPRGKLGLLGDGEISVVNLKCDTRLIVSFRMEPGIFPGWHMNKDHWITVTLDGAVGDETLQFLLETSYEITKK